MALHVIKDPVRRGIPTAERYSLGPRGNADFLQEAGREGRGRSEKKEVTLRVEKPESGRGFELVDEVVGGWVARFPESVHQAWRRERPARLMKEGCSSWISPAGLGC